MTMTPHIDALADPWVLSTDRRLDVLDVPAFNMRDIEGLIPPRMTRAVRLHCLPTALPREIQSFADWLDARPSAARSGLERLSLLFRYLASPLRYEPLNVYQVHRAVPSARCAFPVDLLFSCTGRDSVSRTYLYHPEFHALEEMGHAGTPVHAADGCATVTAVGRVWKVVRKYGDFAPFPVMLEAGMLLAQLRHLRGALGWDGHAMETSRMTAICQGELELPVFSETIKERTFDIDALVVRDATLATQSASMHDVPSFPHLGFFMGLFGSASAPGPEVRIDDVAAAAPGWVPADLGFLETMRLRHSANDRGGMAPRMEDEIDLLPRLSTLAAAIGARRARLPGEARMDVVMLWPGRSAPAAGVYDRQARPLAVLDREQVAVVLNGALSSPELRYNLQAHSMLVLFLVDPQGEGMEEPAAFRDAHVAAGACAQDFCLAAAALHLFARPVRMLQERVMESALQIKGKIVYALLCGTTRATNVCAELL